MERITQLKAENKLLLQQTKIKDRTIESIVREHVKEILGKDAHIQAMAKEHDREMQEEILGKDARIRAMTELHSYEIAKKVEELKALAR